MLTELEQTTIDTLRKSLKAIDAVVPDLQDPIATIEYEVGHLEEALGTVTQLLAMPDITALQAVVDAGHALRSALDALEDTSSEDEIDTLEEELDEEDDNEEDETAPA